MGTCYSRGVSSPMCMESKVIFVRSQVHKDIFQLFNMGTYNSKQNFGGRLLFIQGLTTLSIFWPFTSG